MELADLLVSYKLVMVPDTPQETAPPTRYDNMIDYIRKREQAARKWEQQTPFKWSYRTPAAQQPLTPYAPIMSRNEWVKELTAAYKNLNISDNGIRNLIAKNALESGWGQHTQGMFNYGNITIGNSWTGNYVNGQDHDANGNPITNKFRSYNSIQEFARDEVEFLRRLYDFDEDDSIDTFLSKLQGGNRSGRKYAEDPKYKDAVKKVYRGLK